jgi:hypothetical protein
MDAQRCVALAALVWTAGCGQSPHGAASAPDGGGQASDASAGAPFDAGAGTLDDTAIETLAGQYTSFAKITKTPFQTQAHAGNPMVNVYANSVAEATYSGIDSSGNAPPGFAMPVGSLIVKEMLDPNGGAPILTAMYKKAPGYDTANHDWWYGRLNADGSPTDPSYVGMVSFCIACHSGADTSDFTFGVPAANK